MTFPQRPRSSIELSPKPIRSFLDGAIPPRLYGPNSQRPVSLAYGASQNAGSPSHLKEQTIWPDRRLLDLIKTEFPIVLAPMAADSDAGPLIPAAQARAPRPLPPPLIPAPTPPPPHPH